jgi:hypothetical protein
MRRNQLFLIRNISIGIAFVMLLASCAGIPAQEMYDARQAVLAAKNADAAMYAPDLFSEAEELVRRAKLHMNERDYRQARDDAESARAKAMEARRISEAAAEQTR